jgi:predicted nucleic acid-binding Zn ribbon protein
MKKAGSILDKVMQKLGLTKRYNEQKSLLLWKKVVGSRISSKTNPLYAKNGRLVVEVENSAWMNELLFLKPKIIEKLNREIDKLVIEDIIFLLNKHPDRDSDV